MNLQVAEAMMNQNDYKQIKYNEVMEQIIETPKQTPYEKFRNLFGETMSKIENKEELPSDELFSLILGMTDTIVDVLDENEKTLRKYFEENHKLRAQNEYLHVKNRKLTTCLDDLPAMMRDNNPVVTISTKEITDDFKLVTLSSFMKETGYYHQKLMKILSEKGIMFKNGKSWNLRWEYLDKGYVVYVIGHNKNYSERKLMWTETGVEFLKKTISNYYFPPKDNEATVETQTK